MRAGHGVGCDAIQYCIKAIFLTIEIPYDKFMDKRNIKMLNFTQLSL